MINLNCHRHGHPGYEPKEKQDGGDAPRGGRESRMRPTQIRTPPAGPDVVTDATGNRLGGG